MSVCILDQKYLPIPISLPNIRLFPFLIDKHSSLSQLSHWSTFLRPISHWSTFLSAHALSLVNVPGALIGRRSFVRFLIGQHSSLPSLSHWFTVPLSTSALIGRRSFALLSHWSTFLSVRSY
jgi:hypothetical protein